MTGSADDEIDRLEGAPHPRHSTRLIGHAHQLRDLLELHRAGRLPHAIILGGPEGIGKSTLAWHLAKRLLAGPRDGAGDGPEADPTSAAVAQVVSLSHPDVVLLRREINEKTKRFFTEIRADDVRRAIKLFQRAAGAGGYRICIVDSAEDLNRASANALLKLIEEPPPASLFLLIAHRPGLVLPTIRSRARLIRLRALAAAEIVQVAGNLGPPWASFEEERLAQAAQRAHGSVRQALRLLGGRSLELESEVARILDGLPAVDWRAVHALADSIAGRDGEAAYEATLTAIFDWLGAAVRGREAPSPRRLAPYAELWEKVARSVRETDALNLDKRPLILSIFSDLATAARAASV